LPAPLDVRAVVACRRRIAPVLCAARPHLRMPLLARGRLARPARRTPLHGGCVVMPTVWLKYGGSMGGVQPVASPSLTAIDRECLPLRHPARLPSRRDRAVVNSASIQSVAFVSRARQKAAACASKTRERPRAAGSTRAPHRSAARRVQEAARSSQPASARSQKARLLSIRNLQM